MSQHDLFLYLPVAVGVLVAGGVLIAVARPRSRPKKPPKRSRKPAEYDDDDGDDSFADRRASIRREGTPVQILMTAPSLRNGQGSGYVLDRSTGGLRVAVKSEIAAGTAMQVRAANAPESVPWVTVQVRSCRDSGPHFELGCEFEQTPPWNVLLLFG